MAECNPSVKTNGTSKAASIRRISSTSKRDLLAEMSHLKEPFKVKYSKFECLWQNFLKNFEYNMLIINCETQHKNEKKKKKRWREIIICKILAQIKTAISSIFTHPNKSI